ncbi:hypothetical protein J6590_012996 [Homalodisca vitripennis]|nr:hypothetical protein J6590_012996 [Homalodisca vitripennis]
MSSLRKAISNGNIKCEVNTNNFKLEAQYTRFANDKVQEVGVSTKLTKYLECVGKVWRRLQCQGGHTGPAGPRAWNIHHVVKFVAVVTRRYENHEEYKHSIEGNMTEKRDRAQVP